MSRTFLCALLVGLLTTPSAAYDLDALPKVPDGFKVNIVAREPDLLHPAALCFDTKGRLFVGGGPQFRQPQPDTPPDSIKILIDEDADGIAEKIKTFATGFNCIQAMAWKGNDLWVANCPDITVVRDLDGDDVADQYVLVFTGLGHLRHGLHGFNWGPDGKLYMSQGNSRAQEHAPMAFRKLMHIKSDKPDPQPLNKVFEPHQYKRSYIGNWPSAEGGVLRCDAGGRNLEIFSRGNRNPWDITFDDGFNWLGTDNDDGPEHDRIFSPFYGARFGKMHAWSYSWTGKDNPPTVPMSGLFAQAGGSGVGVVYYTAEQFPEPYRNIFLIGDWQAKHIFRFKPKWDGALLTGELDIMVTGSGTNSLFRPTDVEIGPDGAMYVAGWGAQYGSKHAPYGGSDKNAKSNEGRVFRIWYDKAPLIGRKQWRPDKRGKPYSKWTLAQLIEDLGHQVPVWRVNAQDELVKRGQRDYSKTYKLLRTQQSRKSLSKAQQTWLLWTLGRIEPGSAELNNHFAQIAKSLTEPLNRRIQAIRILAHRNARDRAVDLAWILTDKEPRIRFAVGSWTNRFQNGRLTGGWSGSTSKGSSRNGWIPRGASSWRSPRGRVNLSSTQPARRLPHQTSN